MNSDSDYTSSGFDKFLSRGESTLQGNLDQQLPNNAVSFDRTQISGALGDTLRIGKIYLNGATGTIVLNDGSNDVLVIGSDG